MTNKRITLSVGDYILLSDIPNEQVFDLVKQCFINAGFNSDSKWDGSFCWEVFHAYCNGSACFAGNDDYRSKRQLSLSDVFNSVNGRFNWKGFDYLHIVPDNLIYSNTYSIDLGIKHYIIKRIPATPEAIISPKTSQWWDYEEGCAVGLPPVDTECEYSLHNGRRWFKCRVISQHKLVLHCPHLENDDWNGLQVIGEDDEISFRPLDYKTPKQIAVENALKHSSPAETFEEYTERLYDAGLLKAI